MYLNNGYQNDKEIASEYHQDLVIIGYLLNLYT